MAWLNAMDKMIEFVPPDNLTVLVGFLTENEEWSLENTYIQHFQGTLSVGPTIESNIASLSYAVLLRRQPLYYIVNILIPCITISLVSMFMFFLPIESGEKVSFGITVLLSYTLLLLMVNDITPKGGPRIPLLSE